jgi:hypothetical protein
MPEAWDSSLVKEIPALIFAVREERFIWSHPLDSNQRPADYGSAALPTELEWPGSFYQDRRTCSARPKGRPVAAWPPLSQYYDLALF